MVRKTFFVFLVTLSLLFMVACGDEENAAGDTADTAGSDSDYGAGDTADTADTADSADTGDTMDTANTTDSGSDSDNTGETTDDTSDTADSGDTADTADTADTGDTNDTANSGADETTDGGDTADSGSDADGEAPDNSDTASDEEGNDENLTDQEYIDEDTVSDQDVIVPAIGDLIENPFIETLEDPTSTFSAPHSTATYTIVRNFISVRHKMPDKNKIRIEEMVNYFDYNYPAPNADEPFSYTMEMAQSPWTTGRDLVMIKIKGKTIDDTHNQHKNLVLLVDVSGSMSNEKKLPLIKTSFKMLVANLDATDSVAIVSYSSTAQVVLPATQGNKTTIIDNAIDSLVAGGSTDVGNGLELAYSEANDGFIENGVNRVILATDGDFNTGLTSEKAMMEYIAKQRTDKSIFMTVLGFGITDYDDNIMQVIADNGDGNYYYIDTEKEAYRVFVQKLQGTLFTIAKDLKIQVEFNPLVVERYRLIGYETRMMEDEDFNNDAKDGGEIGAGTSVTAFYEIEKVADAPMPTMSVRGTTGIFEDYEALELRIRYKEPEDDFSHYLSMKLNNEESSADMSEDMGFATAVVEYSMLLRRSAYKENSSYDAVIALATANKGLDNWDLRDEFIDIVTTTKDIDK